MPFSWPRWNARSRHRPTGRSCGPHTGCHWPPSGQTQTRRSPRLIVRAYDPVDGEQVPAAILAHGVRRAVGVTGPDHALFVQGIQVEVHIGPVTTALATAANNPVPHRTDIEVRRIAGGSEHHPGLEFAPEAAHRA